MNRTCPSCGAEISPELRYCVVCYKPAYGARVDSLHTGAAKQMGATRPVDPTVVFLPEEHEAIERRRANRRRLIKVAAGLLLLIAGASTAWLMIASKRAAGRQQAAREEMARREISMLADALEQFRVDVGRYPSEKEGLQSLTRRPFSDLSAWSGPYLDGVYEVDPWGNDYVYRAAAGGEGFELFSYGPAGETEGTVYIRVSSAPEGDR